MAKQRIEYLAVDRLDIERTLVKGGVEVNLSGGGVTGFTPTQNTVAPNDSINASRLLVDVATPSGDAVLQPKGFGAVMAQLPDSTSTGGNKRGSYAVDWQTHRGTAAQVASGNYSVVLGGSSNTAVQDYSVVGGRQNSVTAYSGIVSGYNNATQNTYCFIGSGQNNVISGQNGAVLNGSTNTISGVDSTVLAGNNNTILSGNCLISNGYNNTIQADCTRSTILNSINGNIQNTIAGSWVNNTLINGGRIRNSSNTLCVFGDIITASNSVVIGSGGYIQNGTAAAVIGGLNNQALANNAIALGGEQSYANGTYTVVTGQRGTATQILQRVHGAGPFSNQADCQYERMVLSASTTDATATVLTADKSTATSSNVLVVESNTSKAFHGIVLAHRTDVKQTIAWEIKGLITNIGGTTALVGSPTVTVLGDSTSSGATITVTANDTLDCLAITATGGVGKSFRWLATIHVNKING
jgi:hypothetical protein